MKSNYGHIVGIPHFQPRPCPSFERKPLFPKAEEESRKAAAILRLPASSIGMRMNHHFFPESLF
jgi:hypothetical protein